MKISFAICTHNETREFNELNMLLQKFIDKDDQNEYEIVVIDDFSSDEGMQALLALVELEGVKIHEHALNGDFAAHKNFMNSQCSGDWILNLDADEKISESLLEMIPFLIENNPTIDAYWLPRINTVEGLTIEHVAKWLWSIDKLPGFRVAEMLDTEGKFFHLLRSFDLIMEVKDGIVVYDKPIVCWPDYQMRLYRNSDKIKWERKVHEKLVGYDNYSRLPDEPEYAILHEKDIARQEQQNNFYETIVR